MVRFVLLTVAVRFLAAPASPDVVVGAVIALAENDRARSPLDVAGVDPGGHAGAFAGHLLAKLRRQLRMLAFEHSQDVAVGCLNLIFRHPPIERTPPAD
jgi:hypothetical protein